MPKERAGKGFKGASANTLANAAVMGGEAAILAMPSTLSILPGISLLLALPGVVKPSVSHLPIRMQKFLDADGFFKDIKGDKRKIARKRNLSGRSWEAVSARGAMRINIFKGRGR